MSEIKMILKKWLPLQTSQELSVSQVDRIILVCSGCLPLRICKISDRNARLELLCENEKELLEAEAIINQALADERLREHITAKSDTKVTDIIDSILTRLVGE